ncbi:MAG: 30S ribosomal protein S5 [Candidatus Kerfeldbacteria bacterium]|nr:30S ribosomal protein S5 [Candidatus Kerfeldbacteria bacterium]
MAQQGNQQGNRGGQQRGGGGHNRSNRRQQPKDDFEQYTVDLARVTRVMAGGKRMRFRACVIVGNKKGMVGLGVAKGQDVTLAVQKAALKARKHLIHVPIVNETIPHPIEIKYSSARILLKPARKGRGLIAGGAVRVVLEAAGVPNVVSKMMGSRNKINNVTAVMEALKLLRPEPIK